MNGIIFENYQLSMFNNDVPSMLYKKEINAM